MVRVARALADDDVDDDIVACIIAVLRDGPVEADHPLVSLVCFAMGLDYGGPVFVALASMRRRGLLREVKYWEGRDRGLAFNGFSFVEDTR